MRIVHEVVIRPQSGLEIETAAVLDELGAVYAQAPGFVESYTLDGLEEGGLLARVSIWESTTAVERCAELDQTLALREKLEALAHPVSQGALLDVRSERSGQPAPAIA